MHWTAAALTLLAWEWGVAGLVTGCVLVSVRTLRRWHRTAREACDGDPSPGCLWVRRKLRTEWCILVAQVITLAVSLCRAWECWSEPAGCRVSVHMFGVARAVTAAMFAACVWYNRRSYELLGEDER